MIEGLQDAVHREAMRSNARLDEMERTSSPPSFRAGSARTPASAGCSVMAILSDHVQRYIQKVRPTRSPADGGDGEVRRDRPRPDRALGDGPLPRHTRARHRPGTRAGGRHRDRLLDSAHGAGAGPRQDRHDRARSRPHPPGHRLPGARRRRRTASRSSKAMRRRRSSSLPGPFDFIFLDGTKTEYARYLEMAERKAAERAVLVVDNMLMSGDVALEDDSDAFWSRRTSRARGSSTVSWSAPSAGWAPCCRSATASCSRRAVSLAADFTSR